MLAAGRPAAGEIVEGPAADSLERDASGLPIRQVVIQPRNIFDPVPAGRFAWLYRAANRLHIRTRPVAIRQQLLFKAGQPWRPERGVESMRNLRALDFLTPERIEPHLDRDSVIVVVRTRDTWTTSPEFNLESSGGQRYGSVSFTERNLFGYGKSVSVSYHQEPDGKSRFGSLSDPSVLGTRARAHFMAGTGSVGATNLVSVGVPFYSQDTPVSALVTWTRTTTVERLYQRTLQAASLDERLEETELHYGRGRRRDGTIVRWIGSLLVKDRRLGPSRLEPGAPPDFDGGEENLKLRRLSGEVSLWRPRFVERRDVDRISRIEDFDLGSSASVKLGFSPHLLGGSVDEGYGRFVLGSGVQTPLGFGWTRASVESRLRFTPLEILRRLEARWVNQQVRGQTLVLGVYGVQGERVARDFQVSVGGLSGLRAYPVRALAGRRLWRINLEDRWVLGREYAQLLTLGVAAFYDAARAWGPGAVGTGWFHDAGVGLRIALPRSSQNQVVRFDLAWPIQPTRDGRREAVFSFGSSQAF